MKLFLFMVFILQVSLGSAMKPCNPVKCLVNPCTNYNCPTGTECVPNYCNGCSAQCKPCKQVSCKVNPCSYTKCSAGYYCVPNYCNGCHAECKRCPTKECRPCTFLCPLGTRCIVEENCGKCTYSCSKFGLIDEVLE